MSTDIDLSIVVKKQDEIQKNVIDINLFLNKCLNTVEKIGFELNQKNIYSATKIGEDFLRIVRHFMDFIINLRAIYKYEENFILPVANELGIIEYLNSTIFQLKSSYDPNNLIKNNIKVDINILNGYMDALINFLTRSFSNLHTHNQSVERLNQEIEYQKLIGNLQKEIENVKSAKNALEGTPTEIVYLTAYKLYRNSARWLEGFFAIIISLALWQVKVSWEYINEFPDKIMILIVVKVFLFLIATTAVTFCLTRSSHYRKLSHQAYQSYLELEALPRFTRSFTEENRLEVYKDLVPKYFGKYLDQSLNDKVANIIQDQAKMSIDIAKATTEMVKSLKDVNPDPEPKKDDSK